VPTTVAAFGNTLYLVNARFSTPATPQTPYWITAVRRCPAIPAATTWPLRPPFLTQCAGGRAWRPVARRRCA
jgi:hypothetical protein